MAQATMRSVKGDSPQLALDGGFCLALFDGRAHHRVHGRLALLGWAVGGVDHRGLRLVLDLVHGRPLRNRLHRWRSGPLSLSGTTIWETELGYRRVADSQFAYEDFLVERVSRSVGPFRLSPSAWFSLKGDTARYRLETQYQFAGNLAVPTRDARSDAPPAPDGSFAALTLGFVHQRHAPERFTKSSAELSVDSRYDLARLGPTLRGAFVELSAGYALGRIDYDLVGLDVPHDLEHLLLGRFGFGVLLRGQSAPGSEAVIYYDHRHDDYAAGLKVTGLGSGVIGHFGLGLRWFFNESIGVAADAQVGSAYIAGASLVYRQGNTQ
jgi:hypothetical protein